MVAPSEPIVLRGLAWGHRRAIAPLQAAAREYARRTGIEVRWHARPLGQFEHQPLHEAVQQVDLLVFDHPHCGDAHREGLLLPLDEGVVHAAAAGFAGASLESYRFDGRVWAVPVDAATIHAVYRPDLMQHADAAPPASWDEAIAMATRARRRGLRCMLAARGHHALLTLFSLWSNLGEAPTPARAPELGTWRQGLEELMRMLHACDAAASLRLDAIGVHDAMAREDDVIFCPAAYGYATYGEAGLDPHRLGFAAFPGLAQPLHAGTAIGGAGVGVSAATRRRTACLEYLAFTAATATQQLFAEHHGQPAARTGWLDARADLRFNGYFGAVRGTLESAWIRPRFAGYPKLEQAMALILQRCLRGEAGVTETVQRLASTWTAATA